MSVAREPSWYFPALSGGESQGLNEPGVEMFKEADSLARETVQNVLDNADGTGRPCIVEFEMLDLPSSSFPNLDRFRSIFLACRDKMRKLVQGGAANEERFFQQGLNLLNPEKQAIPTLRIRDMNTTGLRGGDSEHDKPFNRLLRIQGVSSSQGVGGGTYGIGQRAPFQCSALRTLIYYTHRKEDDGEALIAKSILCTHDAVDAPHKPVQAKGWWCIVDRDDPDEWKALRNPSAIPAYFRRTEPGTDLYITGFEAEGWERRVRNSIVRNFFAAIHSGRLVVRVIGRAGRSLLLDKNTIEKTLREAADEEIGSDIDPAERTVTSAYYQLKALQSPVNGKPFIATIEHVGEVQLFVFREEQNPKVPDTCCYMRAPKMVVGEWEVRVIRGFAAALVVENQAGNSFLASLEGPQHKVWSVDELRNPPPDLKQKAARTLKKIRDFVRESLKTLRPGADLKELDLPRLGDFLPEEEVGGSLDPGSGILPVGKATDAPTGVRVQPVVKPPRVKGRAPKPRRDQITLIDDEGQAGSSGGVGPSGSDGDGGDGPGSGGPGDKPGDSGEGKEAKAKVLRSSEVSCRSFADGDWCVAVVQSARSVTGTLSLVAVGEGSTYRPVILEARDAASGASYRVSGPSILGISLQSGQPLRLKLKLDLGSHVCLGIGT